MGAFQLPLLDGLLGGGGGPKGGPGGPGGGCGCPPPPKHGCDDDWGWEKPRGCRPRHHEKHCGDHD